MTDAVRTPDELTADLPDFPYASHYRQWEGLRLAHLDEGEGEQVWFLHGEPTWSFLWRKVFPPVRDAGFRCIVPDLPGFGRSDKPIDEGWYSYDRHTDAIAALVEDLDPRGATMVVHDWGGPIGMRIAVEQPDRFARIVLMDTGLFTGRQQMTDAWHTFRAFVERTEDLPVGVLLRNATAGDTPAEVLRAYEAPFPSVASKAGARAFPAILPLRPEDEGAQAGQRVLDALRADTRPILALWAQEDFALPPETGAAFCAAIGAPPPEPIAGAGHFLQEDRGEEIGARIAKWLSQ
jgi:haloalkane dehalogenase